MSEANFTSWDAFRFPTRWVECFRFGSGVIVEDNYNRQNTEFPVKNIMLFFSVTLFGSGSKFW